MSRTHWLASVTALAAGVALVQAGCAQLDCGPGTIDRGGVCQPADDMPGSALCGAGTHLGTSGTCEPDYPPTVCDPDTTAPETGPDGVTTCKGTSTPTCDSPITCPTPSAGKYTVCGRLYDIKDGTEIRDVPDDTSRCTATTATGPCSLQVKFYDAIKFVGDPTGNPQPTEEIVVDHCGRFYAKNIAMVSQGFVGVGVDDPDGGSADNYVKAGVALAVTEGKAFPGVQAYAVSQQTNTAWAQSAGLSGTTFADMGAYMTIFRYHGVGASGVTITGSTGADPSKSYYFTDSTADSWLAPKPAATQNVTGPDGAAIMVGDSGLANHSGTGGGIPGTCEWPNTQGATIAGVVFIQLKDAMVAGSTTQLCP